MTVGLTAPYEARVYKLFCVDLLTSSRRELFNPNFIYAVKAIDDFYFYPNAAEKRFQSCKFGVSGVSDETTSGHEARARPPSRTCGQKVARDPRTNAHA
ncbi:hypothetical protein EVAR_52461_1 [Eumeta japonica]|uniref:Uncharacterized protein n=1 Tax=Eumeta variegata TaxID=151549 RepID=A0A4C1Z2V4_EUMVA|nr:hypothetical protein EVAR_52461_1 [Eumeta japonica]